MEHPSKQQHPTSSRRTGWTGRSGAGRAGAVALSAVMSLGLLSPGEASAFCRSTTCTGDCPRDENLCKTTGAKLWWASACVGFSLQQDASEFLPIKYAKPPIVNAFLAWSDLECGAGLATLAFSPTGEVACRQTEYNEDSGNANIILFQDNKWVYKGVDNTLAKTTVTFDEETGEILDADIEINHANNHFTVTDEDVAYDLQSIMTHEVGHFIGLDHTEDFDATMFAGYQQGTIEIRTLEQDDIDGACAIYPPGRDAVCDPEPRNGLASECGGSAPADAGGGEEEGGCSVSHGQSSPRPALLFVTLGAALFLRRRRRTHVH